MDSFVTQFERFAGVERFAKFVRTLASSIASGILRSKRAAYAPKPGRGDQLICCKTQDH
jgi:hypothetical protein